MAIRSIFCPKCGSNINADDSREYSFCNKCGRRIIIPQIKKPTQPEIKQKKEVDVIPNLCTRCNGTLKLSANKESAVCEYCGAFYSNKTVFISRDETEIQRAEYDVQKRKIELEAEERKRKLEIEAEEKRKQEEQELEEKQAKRRRVLTEVWCWIFGIVFYIFFVRWAVNQHYGRTSFLLFVLIINTAITCIIVLSSINKKRRNTNNASKVDEDIVSNVDNSMKIGNNGCISMGDGIKNSNSLSTSTSNNVAKGIATGAAIGAGLTAAGLVVKGIKNILK